MASSFKNRFKHCKYSFIQKGDLIIAEEAKEVNK
jgi:hypothetical protein